MPSDEECRGVRTSHPRRDEGLHGLRSRIGSTHLEGQIGDEGVPGVGGDRYAGSFSDSVERVRLCAGSIVVVVVDTIIVVGGVDGGVGVSIVTSRWRRVSNRFTECTTATFPSRGNEMLG